MRLSERQAAQGDYICARSDGQARELDRAEGRAGGGRREQGHARRELGRAIQYLQRLHAARDDRRGCEPPQHGLSSNKTAQITSDCDSNTLARAGVVVFGEPSGFPTTYAGFGDAYGAGEPDLSRGVSSMMLNNLWGTNSCRRDCPYVDALSPSLLKYLLNVEEVQQSESLADG